MDQTWESLLDSASQKVATGSASFVAELRRNLHCIGPSTQGENMAFTTNRKLPRSVLVLVATCWSLLIAACGAPERTQPQPGPPPGCQGAECNVNVNVNNCVVSVAPDPIPVPKNFEVIKWTIKSADYQFQDSGITIKNPGSGITPDPGVIGNGTMFKMHDDHTVHGTITYTVTVVPNSGGQPCVLDPIIFNQ
jgi:hypothetical protein